MKFYEFYKDTDIYYNNKKIDYEFNYSYLIIKDDIFLKNININNQEITLKTDTNNYLNNFKEWDYIKLQQDNIFQTNIIETIKHNKITLNNQLLKTFSNTKPIIINKIIPKKGKIYKNEKYKFHGDILFNFIKPSNKSEFIQKLLELPEKGTIYVKSSDETYNYVINNTNMSIISDNIINLKNTDIHVVNNNNIIYGKNTQFKTDFKINDNIRFINTKYIINKFICKTINNHIYINNFNKDLNYKFIEFSSNDNIIKYYEKLQYLFLNCSNFIKNTKNTITIYDDNSDNFSKIYKNIKNGANINISFNDTVKIINGFFYNNIKVYTNNELKQFLINNKISGELKVLNDNNIVEYHIIDKKLILKPKNNKVYTEFIEFENLTIKDPYIMSIIDINNTSNNINLFAIFENNQIIFINNSIIDNTFNRFIEENNIKKTKKLSLVINDNQTTIITVNNFYYNISYKIDKSNKLFNKIIILTDENITRMNIILNGVEQEINIIDKVLYGFDILEKKIDNIEFNNIYNIKTTKFFKLESFNDIKLNFPKAFKLELFFFNIPNLKYEINSIQTYSLTKKDTEAQIEIIISDTELLIKDKIVFDVNELSPIIYDIEDYEFELENILSNSIKVGTFIEKEYLYPSDSILDKNNILYKLSNVSNIDGTFSINNKICKKVKEIDNNSLIIMSEIDSVNKINDIIETYIVAGNKTTEIKKDEYINHYEYSYILNLTKNISFNKSNELIYNNNVIKMIQLNKNKLFVTSPNKLKFKSIISKKAYFDLSIKNNKIETYLNFNDLIIKNKIYDIIFTKKEIKINFNYIENNLYKIKSNNSLNKILLNKQFIININSINYKIKILDNNSDFDKEIYECKVKLNNMPLIINNNDYLVSLYKNFDIYFNNTLYRLDFISISNVKAELLNIPDSLYYTFDFILEKNIVISDNQELYNLFLALVIKNNINVIIEYKNNKTFSSVTLLDNYSIEIDNIKFKVEYNITSKNLNNNIFEIEDYDNDLNVGEIIKIDDVLVEIIKINNNIISINMNLKDNPKILKKILTIKFLGLTDNLIMIPEYLNLHNNYLIEAIKKINDYDFDLSISENLYNYNQINKYYIKNEETGNRYEIKILNYNNNKIKIRLINKILENKIDIKKLQFICTSSIIINNLIDNGSSIKISNINNELSTIESNNDLELNNNFESNEANISWICKMNYDSEISNNNMKLAVDKMGNAKIYPLYIYNTLLINNIKNNIFNIIFNPSITKFDIYSNYIKFIKPLIPNIKDCFYYGSTTSYFKFNFIEQLKGTIYYINESSCKFIPESIIDYNNYFKYFPDEGLMLYNFKLVNYRKTGNNYLILNNNNIKKFFNNNIKITLYTLSDYLLSLISKKIEIIIDNTINDVELELTESIYIRKINEIKDKNFVINESALVNINISDFKEIYNINNITFILTQNNNNIYIKLNRIEANKIYFSFNDAPIFINNLDSCKLTYLGLIFKITNFSISSDKINIETRIKNIFKNNINYENNTLHITDNFEISSRFNINKDSIFSMIKFDFIYYSLNNNEIKNNNILSIQKDYNTKCQSINNITRLDIISKKLDGITIDNNLYYYLWKKTDSISSNIWYKFYINAIIIIENIFKNDYKTGTILLITSTEIIFSSNENISDNNYESYILKEFYDTDRYNIINSNSIDTDTFNIYLSSNKILSYKNIEYKNLDNISVEGISNGVNEIKFDLDNWNKIRYYIPISTKAKINDTDILILEVLYDDYKIIFKSVKEIIVGKINFELEKKIIVGFETDIIYENLYIPFKLTKYDFNNNVNSIYAKNNNFIYDLDFYNYTNNGNFLLTSKKTIYYNNIINVNNYYRIIDRYDKNHNKLYVNDDNTDTATTNITYFFGLYNYFIYNKFNSILKIRCNENIKDFHIKDFNFDYKKNDYILITDIKTNKKYIRKIVSTKKITNKIIIKINNIYINSTSITTDIKINKIIITDDNISKMPCSYDSKSNSIEIKEKKYLDIINNFSLFIGNKISIDASDIKYIKENTYEISLLRKLVLKNIKEIYIDNIYIVKINFIKELNNTYIYEIILETLLSDQEKYNININTELINTSLLYNSPFSFDFKLYKMEENSNNFIVTDTDFTYINNGFFLSNINPIGNITNFIKQNIYNINIELIKKSTITIETPVFENHYISWIKKVAYYMINYIDFYIGDKHIERFDSDWLNIYENLLKPESSRYNKMIGNVKSLTEPKISINEDLIYLPLNFWFCNKPGLYLPLISLNNTDVKFIIKLNEFVDCITSTTGQYDSSDFDFSILANYVYLDDIERKLFAEAKHEYLIEQVQILPQVFITEPNVEIPLILKNCVKDLIWIFKPLENIFEKDFSNYIFKVENDDPELLDSFQYNYLQNYKLYIKYKTGNIENIPIFFIKEYQIIDEIDQIKDDSERLNEYLRLLYFNKDTPKNIINRSIKIYNHFVKRGSVKIKNIEPLDKCSLKLMGNDNIGINNGSFYSNLQYLKYKKTPDKGIYIYPFSLYPTDYQPSGSINMTFIEDILLQMKLNDIIEKKPAYLNCYSRSYNILRIMSGLGDVVFE